jgi:phage-related protein
MKPVVFVGNSRNDLRAFPDPVRNECGQELMRVQYGVMPSDFKPMPAVGSGAYEIRVQLEGQWRVIYVAKLPEAIYVLHAFKKKTQQTAQSDINLAAKRYQTLGE